MFVFIMGKKHNIIFLILAYSIATFSSFAQVNFTSKVQDLELVPRNTSNNLGTVKFEGTVLGSKYNLIRVVQYINKVKKSDVSQSLGSSSSLLPFSYSLQIKAGKIRYDFEVYFYGTDTFEYTAQNVVCGDVYIIQGQSNAVANAYNGLANPVYRDSFMRSFGTSDYTYNVCAADTFWHFVNGDNYYSAGSIGQWGLVLAKYILDSFKMPVAILNGAVGGTPVSSHQKYKIDPENLYTIYGRLLYRMRKAKLQNAVRGLFYFQGESDGPYPKLHDSLFKILYKDWMQDFKNIKKYYVVQVRGGGCGGPTAEFLEVQRQFEFNLPNCKVISANGLNAHDGCHYGFVNGYQLLGNCLSPLVARDLYGKTNLKNIDPPNIQSAEYVNADYTKIALTMQKSDDSIFVDPNFHKLFYVSGDTGIAIVSGNIVNNKVVLNLNKGTCKTLKLTYMGQAGVQPWVKSKTKAGLIGFNNLVINKPAPKLWYSACPKSTITVGEDSIQGYKYNWKNLNDNKIHTTANFKLLVTKNEQFRLILTNNLNQCKYDTFFVNVVMDQTTAPNLGKDTTLCKNDTITYALQNLYSEISWKINQKSSSNSKAIIDTTSNIFLKVKSNVGCYYYDTVNIQYSYPSVKIIAPPALCPKTDTVISANKTYPFYQWNSENWSTVNKIKVNAGTHKLIIKDDFGCTASDSVFIAEHKKINYEKIKLTFCKSDSAIVNRPASLKSWKNNTGVLAKNYYFKFNSDPVFFGNDSNFCDYTDTINPTVLALPVFSLGADTSVCEGSVVKTICPAYADKYFWNKQLSFNNYFLSSNEKLIHCKITNKDNCSYEEERNIIYNPKPKLFFPNDTTLCEGKTLNFISDSTNNYLLNNLPVPSISISKSGTYYIGIKNKYACIENKNINVGFVLCTNSMLNSNTEFIKLYPNPSFGIVNISNNSNSEVSFLLINSLGVSVFSGNISEYKTSTLLTSNFRAGHYTLKCILHNQTIIKTILLN